MAKGFTQLVVWILGVGSIERVRVACKRMIHWRHIVWSVWELAEEFLTFPRGRHLGRLVRGAQ
jgi:hypothetical protein